MSRSQQTKCGSVFVNSKWTASYIALHSSHSDERIRSNLGVNVLAHDTLACRLEQPATELPTFSGQSAPPPEPQPEKMWMNVCGKY